MARGFLYLVAIMDWHSRYVVAWRLSNTLDTGFCAEALGDALNQGTPDVFNTDQGSQFTSREFTQILQDHSVKISMDGRGRYQDNILVERLWRTVKYEEVYLKAYVNGLEARNGLREYFRFYNHRRPHQALGYRTPAEVFYGEPVDEEVPGPTGLGIIRRSAGVPINCGLILPNRWGPPQNDRSTLLLEHHLKELKLPSFLREYGKMAAQCAAEGVDHPQYLLRLAELELIDRHQRMVERRIRAARFPAVKSLDTFDFPAIPSPNKALVMELAPVRIHPAP